MAGKNIGVSEETALKVIERDLAGCAVKITHPTRARKGEQIHHRKPRGMGGTSDPHSEVNTCANLVFICRECHEWVESHRYEAVEKGWLIQGRIHPSEAPIFYGGTWKILSIDGQVLELQEA